MQILEAANTCEIITSNTRVARAFQSSLGIWNELSNGAEMPNWKVDHLMEFPVDLIPYANVIRRDVESNDYRFLFWGSSRTELMKFDYTGKQLSELRPGIYADIVKREIDQALSVHKPVKSSIQVQLENGNVTQVNKIRLPFFDQNDVAAIVLSLDDVTHFQNRFYLMSHRSKD